MTAMNTNDHIWNEHQARSEAQAMRDFEAQYLRIMGAISDRMNLDVHLPGKVNANVEPWVLDTLNWLQEKIAWYRHRLAEFEKAQQDRWRLGGL